MPTVNADTRAALTTEPLPPGATEHTFSRRDPTGATVAGNQALADEVPVEIRLNGAAAVVTMATPCDLTDLALGFLLTESHIATPACVTGFATEARSPGFIIDVSAELSAEPKFKTRSLAARTSCGLCGVSTLAEAIAETPRVTRKALPDAAAVQAALTALDAEQELNNACHAVHGAAYCDTAGTVVLAREDVGRHNAIDKLAGALACRTETPPGFALVTSRVSYEIVQKAAMCNIATLVAISAPTTLAIELAENVDMNIIAVARRDNHRVFVAGGKRDGNAHD